MTPDAGRSRWSFECRKTGAIHWASKSADVEDEVPDDIHDGSLYVAVPHGIDLGLGKRLGLAFTEQVLPDSRSEVAGFFRRTGAFQRFKASWVANGASEEWQEFESLAIARALREWSEQQGLRVISWPPRPKGERGTWP